jgi:hypothetical protein
MIWCGYAHLKDRVPLIFDGTAVTKTAFFIAVREVPH